VPCFLLESGVSQETTLEAAAVVSFSDSICDETEADDWTPNNRFNL
jgi:hypothetical protein